MNIEEAKKVITEYRRNLLIETFSNLSEFDKIMNRLINTTPTGELRNDLTSLNILFQIILTNTNELHNIKID
jgi:hypothetical protein